MSNQAGPHGADPMQSVLERGDDAEVAAASPERPEQIRMIRLARRDNASIVKDHVSG
jgi:hypothetical protein